MWEFFFVGICFAFYYDKFYFKKYFRSFALAREKIKQLANIHNILSYSQHSSILLSIFFVCTNNSNNARSNNNNKKETNKQTFSLISFIRIIPVMSHTHTLFMWQWKQLHPFVSSFNALYLFDACSIIKISMKYMAKYHFRLDSHSILCVIYRTKIKASRIIYVFFSTLTCICRR